MIKATTPEFEKDLSSVLNKHSIDSATNTPDFILARYLKQCIETYIITKESRDAYFEPHVVEHEFPNKVEL